MKESSWRPTSLVYQKIRSHCGYAGATYDALRPGAKLVTVDGVWTEKQRAATRWLLSRDRGEHIRHEEEYVSIASEVFSQMRRSIRHDLSRIPYSHLILECVR
jgi:hypothetical protein